MNKFILHNVKEIQKVGDYLRAAEDYPLDVVIYKHKKDRNLAQNRLIAKCYTEIGKQSGNGFAYERGYYKFHFGSTILVRDDKDFAEYWDSFLELFEYEQAIKALGTKIINVSSIMNITQASEYIDAIYKDAYERGFHLSKTEDLYLEAMNR